MAYRFSIFIIGLIIAAYWMRVLRMARKARQKTGRAANFLPPELVGRTLRVLWIPVVIVWIVHPILLARKRNQNTGGKTPGKRGRKATFVLPTLGCTHQTKLFEKATH